MSASSPICKCGANELRMNVQQVPKEDFRSLASKLDHMGTVDRFSIVDIVESPEKSTLHVASAGDELKGYLHVYQTESYGIGRLLGDVEAAEHLLPFLPKGRMIMMCQASLQQVVRKKYPDNPTYLEQLMTVNNDELQRVDISGVSRLVPDDAQYLHDLYMTGEFSSRARLSSVESFSERLSNETGFCLKQDGRLVSVAMAIYGDETFGMVGGVYTDPSHRGRGYGSTVTCAATEYLLQRSSHSMLYVRKDNSHAIRAYEKLGYAEREEWAYFDFGTGIIP